MRKPKTKSPIKAAPLRNPGQGIEDSIDRVVNDQAMPWIVMTITVVLLAALEWWRWFTNPAPNPWAMTGVALIFAVFGVWRILKFRREVQNLRLGLHGEKAVGQLLDTYREDGFRVFHDIPGEGFNVDHVLIGPPGVFTIETKTWSKPAKGRGVIHVNGEQLEKNGLSIGDGPIIQAKAQSTWLRRLLEESTGKQYRVKAVLVFPGWFIESKGQNDVWVLEPKGLKTFLANTDVCLTKEEIHLASFHLSRYIRSAQD